MIKEEWTDLLVYFLVIFTVFNQNYFQNESFLFAVLQNPQSTFLKEMTYRASNQRHHGEVSSPSTNLNNAYRIIKEVLKKFRSREAEERERANLVEQDVLVIDPTKSAFRLRDLYIRPNIVSKRITGKKRFL